MAQVTSGDGCLICVHLCPSVAHFSLGSDIGVQDLADMRKALTVCPQKKKPRIARITRISFCIAFLCALCVLCGLIPDPEEVEPQRARRAQSFVTSSRTLVAAERRPRRLIGALRFAFLSCLSCILWTVHETHERHERSPVFICVHLRLIFLSAQISAFRILRAQT